MIEAWKRVLVLAPHTDDGEFGCGGTMARLVEAGEVHYHAFSIATRSLPEGFALDTLAREVREATAELGIADDQLRVHDFDVRIFLERRTFSSCSSGSGRSCGRMASASHHDVHQDHQTIAQEGCARSSGRPCSATRSLNNFDFSYGAYVALEQRHLEKKVMVGHAGPQRPCRYANPEYVWNRPRAWDQRQPRVRASASRSTGSWRSRPLADAGAVSRRELRRSQ